MTGQNGQREFGWPWSRETGDTSAYIVKNDIVKLRLAQKANRASRIDGFTAVGHLFEQLVVDTGLQRRQRE